MAFLHWQLQDAKNKLSEVIDRAEKEGPQTITRRGKETAVVLSMQDYLKLTKPVKTLRQLLLDSPWSKTELNLERSKELPRDIDL